MKLFFPHSLAYFRFIQSGIFPGWLTSAGFGYEVRVDTSEICVFIFIETVIQMPVSNKSTCSNVMKRLNPVIYAKSYRLRLSLSGLAKERHNNSSINNNIDNKNTDNNNNNNNNVETYHHHHTKNPILTTLTLPPPSQLPPPPTPTQTSLTTTLNNKNIKINKQWEVILRSNN